MLLTNRSQSLRQGRGSLKTFVVVAASGVGSRFCSSLPKQFCDIGGEVPIRRTVELFLSLDFIDGIVCVIPKGFGELYSSIMHDLKDARLLPFVFGGESRSQSVREGIVSLKSHNPDFVLIHDAVRCFFSCKLVKRVLASLLGGARAVSPVVPPVDSLRFLDGHGSLDRSLVGLVQTPQGFVYDDIAELQEKYKELQFSDEASLFDHAGIKVDTVEGEQSNKKITFPSDVKTRETFKAGFGYDAHRFSPGQMNVDGKRKLYLMGIEIEFDRSLEGVSDADVGIHSLVDAIIGALSLGSIGEFFPPSDPRNLGKSSIEFLEYCKDLLASKGSVISNIDTTIVCEAPNISKYAKKMKRKIAEILNVSEDVINIKGKTTEGMGFEGRQEGISASTIVTIRTKK